jgi:RNA polymerase sigma factor (sigma-70 family)
MLRSEDVLDRQQEYYRSQYNGQDHYSRYKENIERFYESMSDYDLISACQNHNEQAFEQFIKRYDPIITSRIYRYVSDHGDRADIRQDALIKIWQSIGTLRTREAFRVWLHRLVTHLIYDYLSQKSQTQAISLDCSTFPEDEQGATEREIPDSSSIPDKLCEDSELAGELRNAITKLPSHFKHAVLLREFVGLSYEDIAQRTGTEVGTVKSRISRARSRVRTEMENYLTAGAGYRKITTVANA